MGTKNVCPDAIRIHYVSRTISLSKTDLLGLVGREPARRTSEPGLNPSWDATARPVC